MEAGAIAWVTETDLVDGERHTHEEVLENLHTAFVALQAAMPEIIEHVV
jgi:hypothetical protein